MAGNFPGEKLVATGGTSSARQIKACPLIAESSVIHLKDADDRTIRLSSSRAPAI
jgi:hypothetical protein